MTTLVKTIGAAISDGIRKIKVVFGGSNVQNVHAVTPFGDDSCPPDNLIAAHATTTVKGVNIVYGYYNKHQVAQKGEKRIYSTNTAGDSVQMYLYLKNNGTAEFGGTADNLMRYAAFNTQMQTYLTSLNAAILAGVSSAGGAYTAPTAPNFNSAKITEIKTS